MGMNKMCISTILVTLLSLASIESRAQSVSDVDLTRVNEIFQSLQKQQTKSASAESTAFLWALDIQKNHQLTAGRAFLFYGRNEAFWYHVVPFLMVNGTRYVLDRTYFETPLPLDTWATENGEFGCKVVEQAPARAFSSSGRDLSAHNRKCEIVLTTDLKVFFPAELPGNNSDKLLSFESHLQEACKRVYRSGKNRKLCFESHLDQSALIK